MYFKDQGTHTIYVHFSGSGDDGGIDEVEFWDHNDKSIGIARDNYYDIEGQFYSMINSHTALEGDWINNDGGYGELIINLEKNEYEVEVHFRREESYAWDNQPFL